MTRSRSRFAALSLVLALLSAGCAHSSGAPATAIAEPEIAAAYLPLYARVHLGLDSAVGAAVVIAPGIAVTNDHNDNLVAPRTVLGFGSSSDLMFFRTARHTPPSFAPPVLGETVTAYGQGADRELRVAHGVICHIERAPGQQDSPYFIFAGNAGPGFSGGPILNAQGRLVGITFAYLDRPGGRRLIFAYDTKRVMAELALKKRAKAGAEAQSGLPALGGCDPRP